MRQRIELNNILGITVSKTSNEFVIHEKILEDDKHFLSLRKIEFLSTLAECYYKFNNTKLKFSIVEEESLKSYVTTEKQKRNENIEFTLMKNDINYIEDLFNKEKSPETIGKDEENQQLVNKKENEDNLGNKMSEMGEKDKYDFNLESDANPFTGVLVGGAVATGAGVGAAAGSIAACLAFDSVFLASTAGEIFAAGFTFIGGAAISGIGLIIAVPSLIGFGIYQIYKVVKNQKRKEFFESFHLDKMKIEKEVQKYAICKIDIYFNKRIIIENLTEIENYINDIIDIYIETDNKIIENKLIQYGKENNLLLEKIQIDGIIISNNISKIRQELMKTILGVQSKKKNIIFQKSIPLFKEFIKTFGPQIIDKKNEKKIDKNIDKIIDIMKEILEKKMAIAFDRFSSKVFINSFDLELEKKYEDKKLVDNISKEDFIIEPIADNSINYGVLALFFKFSLIVQRICAKKKEENYQISREKILNYNLNNNENNNEYNRENNSENNNENNNKNNN